MERRAAKGGGMKLRSICLHGPESTGKSTIAPELARHFGSACVVEYGRTYTEAFGTNWTMADLVAIAQAHDAQSRQAIATRSAIVQLVPNASV